VVALTSNAGLPPLTWHSFCTTWHLDPLWCPIAGVLLLGYTTSVIQAARRGSRPVHPARMVAFGTGIVALVVATSSAIATYAMALFWMHMIEHLALIMLVPALLVLGHPLAAAQGAGGPTWQRMCHRVLWRSPVAIVLHPAVGLMVYTAVIIATHLTSFMDQMASHPWLMPLEQVAYVTAGYLFLVGTIGEEPTRWNPPYLARLALLVLGMIPDTLVGIVLLQTEHVPFPSYMAMRPAWAPGALDDLHVGAVLMWVAGDGLMMCMSVGVVVSLIAGPTRDRFLGPWLESARAAHIADGVRRTGGDIAIPVSVDDDEDVLNAYNAMLKALREKP
jgi:cytochrome c oxidase assembly factor CtaG